MNLFGSFILRALSVILKELLVHILYNRKFTDDAGWNSYYDSAVRSPSTPLIISPPHLNSPADHISRLHHISPPHLTTPSHLTTSSQLTR